MVGGGGGGGGDVSRHVNTGIDPLLWCCIAPCTVYTSFHALNLHALVLMVMYFQDIGISHRYGIQY